MGMEASIWYLFTASTPGLKRFTPMPWTIQLLFLVIPAVNMINKKFTIFTAHKTMHMPAQARSCTQHKHSHLINVHRCAASLTGCWYCKARLHCPCKPQISRNYLSHLATITDNVYLRKIRCSVLTVISDKLLINASHSQG